ncbi:hypothetical protein MKZ38_010613 [Zalerion maritima]|uniref:Uncharacterized protein n=1 Tax=Zalerion maritima TaxID=339359 RepID=A0AAD5RTR5_9PEZI|nr:hypothetical protein MKZ38_010613 [Zalerion maritima]
MKMTRPWVRRTNRSPNTQIILMSEEKTRERTTLEQERRWPNRTSLLKLHMITHHPIAPGEVSIPVGDLLMNDRDDREAPGAIEEYDLAEIPADIKKYYKMYIDAPNNDKIYCHKFIRDPEGREDITSAPLHGRALSWIFPRAFVLIPGVPKRSGPAGAALMSGSRRNIERVWGTILQSTEGIAGASAALTK